MHSNAAFAVSVLVEHSTVDLSPQYLHLLAALHPLFEVPSVASTAKLNARNNAAGAVSRMILKKSEAIPLDQVLPVIVGILPLKNDFHENRPAFRALFHLFRSVLGVIAPYLDQLLLVFAHVLDPSVPDQLGDEVRAELIQLVRALNAENPAKVQAADFTAICRKVFIAFQLFVGDKNKKKFLTQPNEAMTCVLIVSLVHARTSWSTRPLLQSTASTLNNTELLQ